MEQVNAMVANGENSKDICSFVLSRSIDDYYECCERMRIGLLADERVPETEDPRVLRRMRTKIEYMLGYAEAEVEDVRDWIERKYAEGIIGSDTHKQVLEHMEKVVKDVATEKARARRYLATTTPQFEYPKSERM